MPEMADLQIREFYPANKNFIRDWVQDLESHSYLLGAMVLADGVDAKHGVGGLPTFLVVDDWPRCEEYSWMLS